MIKDFIQYLEVEKRYSLHTITSYKKDLEDFELFVFKQEACDSIQLISKKVVRNYLVFLSQKTMSKRSINRKLSTLRSYYHYLLKYNHINLSPMEGISSFRFYPVKQLSFSEQEMDQLQELMQDNEDVLANVIIETLYQTGMRKSELCQLKQNDVHLDQLEIKLIGKGNKQRLIPISEDLLSHLIHYQSQKMASSDGEFFYFTNHKGKKLNEKFVYQKVNDYLSLVSTKKKTSPHILRHSFATHLLNSGAEITKVKKMMGHSSLASTQVYTEANIEVLKYIINQSHPLSDIKPN